MTDICWLPLGFQDGENYTFPTPQQFEHTGGNAGQIYCPSPMTGGMVVALTLTTGFGSDFGFGVATAAALAANVGNIRDGYNAAPAAQTAFLAENGAVVCNAVVLTSISGISTGNTVLIYITPDETGIYFSFDGVNWNGSHSVSDVAAGTGKFALTGPGPWYPLVTFSAGAGSVTIAGTAATITLPVPSGATYPPATPFLAVIGVTPTGTTSAAVGFTNANAAPTTGLLVNLNATAPAAASGSSSGASGTLTISQTLNTGLNTAVVADATYPLAVSAPFVFAAGSGYQTWVTTTVAPTSSGLTISSDGLTVVATGNVTAQVVSANPLPTSGTVRSRFYFTGNTGDQAGVGIIETPFTNAEGLTWNYGAGAAAVVSNNNAAIYVNGASGGVGNLLNTNIPPWSYVDVVVNLDAALIFFVAPSGEVNGTSSAYVSTSPSATASATGGFPISALTAPLYWAAGWHGSSTGDAIIADFDVPLVTLVSAKCILNEPVTLIWESTAPIDGLYYSLDGAPLQPCTNVISGTSGFALGPTITDTGFHTISLAPDTNGQAPTLIQAVVPAPSGAGGQIAMVQVTGKRANQVGTITASFSPTPQILFAFSGLVTPDVGNGNNGGSPSAQILGTYTATGDSFQKQITSFGWGTHIDPNLTFAPTSATPSGSTTFPIGNDFSMLGFFTQTKDIDGNTLLQYTAISNGVTLVYDTTATGYPGVEFIGINISDGGSGATFGANNTVSLQGAVYYYPSPSESIVLETATYSAGTLSTTGTCTGGTLTALNISTSNGASFAASTTSTFNGDGSWEASLAGSLTFGTYFVQVEDGVTGALSNIRTLVLASESLTITEAGGVIGGTLTFGGVANNGAPAAQDISVNGTWSEAGAYSIGTGTANVAFSGSGPTLTVTGDVVLQSRDHSIPSIVSNFFTYTVPTNETVTLTAASASIGETLSIGGLFNGQVASSLNVSVNGTVSAVNNFSSGTGSLNVAWTGSGPVMQVAGTFPVFVEDPAFSDVVSNTVDVFIPAGSPGGGFTLPTGGYLGSIPNWTVSDFFAAFQRLMPRGAAWPTSVTAVMNQVLLALLPGYPRVAQAAAAILEDAFPPTAVNLLYEWQQTLALPDACTPGEQTLAQQQAAVLEKFTRGGSLSVGYYLNVAALFGYEITIVEADPSTRTWTIHAPFIAPPVVFRAGQSLSGDSLSEIQGNAELECVFRQIQPADTLLLFSYP